MIDSEMPREVEHPPWYVRPDVCRVGFSVFKTNEGQRTKSGIPAVVGPQEATTADRCVIVTVNVRPFDNQRELYIR